MKKQVIGLFAMMFILGVFVISCDEDLLGDDLLNPTQIEEEDQQTVVDNSEAELKVARVFENINNFGISEDGKKSADLEGCPDVTWAGKVLTLDFNSCASGQSGVIVAEFSQENPHYGMPGLSADVTFDSYSNEGTVMAGKIKLTLTGLAGAGFGPTFKVEVLEDLSFTEGSESHMWDAGSERIFKWIEGFATLDDNYDDVYTLEGNSSGVNTDGIAYEVNITSALYFDMSCEWVPQGTIEIVNYAGSEDEKTLTISFDTGATAEATEGECDSWVLITAGSISIRVDVNQ